MPDWCWAILWVVVGLAFFTDFYGLGNLWANRGQWFVVEAEQLATVMLKLQHMHAFNDSDGVPLAVIKVKAHAVGFGTTDVYYTVKVPTYVFKNAKYNLTEAKKAELLGLTERSV